MITIIILAAFLHQDEFTVAPSAASPRPPGIIARKHRLGIAGPARGTDHHILPPCFSEYSISFGLILLILHLPPAEQEQNTGNVSSFHLVMKKSPTLIGKGESTILPEWRDLSCPSMRKGVAIFVHFVNIMKTSKEGGHQTAVFRPRFRPTVLYILPPAGATHPFPTAFPRGYPFPTVIPAPPKNPRSPSSSRTAFPWVCR